MYSFIITGFCLFVCLLLARFQRKNKQLKQKNKLLNDEMKFQQTSFLIPYNFEEINKDLFYKHFSKLHRGIRIYLDIEQNIYVNENVRQEIQQLEIYESRSLEPLAGIKDQIYTPIC
jgi:U3 small nucleolar ribonucleoprotein component